MAWSWGRLAGAGDVWPERRCGARLFLALGRHRAERRPGCSASSVAEWSEAERSDGAGAATRPERSGVSPQRLKQPYGAPERRPNVGSDKAKRPQLQGKRRKLQTEGDNIQQLLGAAIFRLEPRGLAGARSRSHSGAACSALSQIRAESNRIVASWIHHENHRFKRNK